MQIDCSDEETRYLFNDLSSALPGRTARDISLFIQDGMPLSRYPAIVNIKELTPERPRKWMPSLARRELGTLSNLRKYMVRRSMLNLRPEVKLDRGSGDVIEVGFAPDGKNFVLACTASPDEYNRVGNLRLGNITTGTVTLLNKHRFRPDGADGMYNMPCYRQCLT